MSFRKFSEVLTSVSQNMVDNVSMLLCGVCEIASRQYRILQGVVDTVKVSTNIGIDVYLLPIPFNTSCQWIQR